MNPELQEALVHDFPILYQEYGKGKAEGGGGTTPFGWSGFEIGDGWEPIVRQMSKSLEAINELAQFNHTTPIVCHQCKEKFGGLRFYIGPHEADEKIEDWIAHFENLSLETCEDCGAPGTLQGDGWMRTLCDPCQMAFLERRFKRLPITK